MKKNPNLPIQIHRRVFDKHGFFLRVEIDIKRTNNRKKYKPDGIKAVFKVLKEIDGDFEELLLIDNHEPYGFHFHDKLPQDHDSRIKIYAKNYQEAWDIFDLKLEDLLNEAENT